MEIRDMPVLGLVHDPLNARKHDRKNIDAIKGSLLRFGQQKPIVVNRSGVVIAGNGTLEAARELGWRTIQVYETELDDFNASAFAIADNRTAELATWDEGVLGKTLHQLREMDFDLPSIGFDTSYLDSMNLATITNEEWTGTAEGYGPETLPEAAPKPSSSKKSHTCPQCNYEF